MIDNELKDKAEEIKSDVAAYEKLVRENFEKGLKLIQYAMSHHERLCKEILKSAELLVTKDNEQIEQLKKEMEEVKKSIILSTDNANRNGRPPLTDEEIDLIREFLAQGYSQRKTAEMVGVSNGAVAKYSKDVTPRKKTTMPTKKGRTNETLTLNKYEHLFNGSVGDKSRTFYNPDEKKDENEKK